jgi:hypothetical protein
MTDEELTPQPINAGQTDRMELTPKEPPQPKPKEEKPAAEVGEGSKEPDKEAAPPVEEKPVEPNADDLHLPFLNRDKIQEQRNIAVKKKAAEILELMEADLIEHIAAEPGSTRYAFKIEDAAADCIGVIINSMAYAGWKVIYDGNYTLTVLLPQVEPIIPAMLPRRVSVNSPL